MNVDKFKDELIFTGRIIHDSDESVIWLERENRFNRYIKLIESAKGNEGIETAQAIIQSMQSEQDYGAYQIAQSILGRFPGEIFTLALIKELPSFIHVNSECVGELICA